MPDYVANWRENERANRARKQAAALRRQWQKEAIFARNELIPGHATDPTSTWWLPHLVYILKLRDEPLYKVGLTRVGARRLRDVTAAGRAAVVTTIEFPNRWFARLVELDILESRAQHYFASESPAFAHGRHECWAIAGGLPDLGETVRRVQQSI